MSAVQLRSVPRVVIADNHPPTRHGIRRLLTGAGYEVVDEAASGEAALEAVRAHRPELCILDVRMPGDGIVAAAQIVREVPEIAVVMLTAAPGSDTVVRALRAGAVGVLAKDVGARDLIRGLQRVVDGEVSLPEEVLTAMAMPPPRLRRWSRRAALPPAPDTQVEQVLILLRNQVTIAAAANVLGLSQRRVREIVVELLSPVAVGS